MKVLTTIAALKDELKQRRERSVGLVPTMGFLHEGHRSLVRACRKENDICVVSIYVNPAQFGPREDLERYPRDMARDRALLEKEGVDIQFAPENNEMYPPGYATYTEVERLGAALCGRSRPTHFRGVATVVLKLFHIVNPDRAYFGRKDAQQAIIIKRMARDLDMDTAIRVLPIVRDADGLALSSRNVYLTPSERQAARRLPLALELAEEMIRQRIHDSNRIIETIRHELGKEQLIDIEYVEAVDFDLRPLAAVNTTGMLIACAIRIGRTRLIDNLTLGEI